MTRLVAFSLFLLWNCSIALGSLRVMSYNIWGWKDFNHRLYTMAKVICDNNVDVVGIQEGVQDNKGGGSLEYRGGQPFPTEARYWRARSVYDKLNSICGGCYRRYYEIIYNACRGVSLVSSNRYDLPDGPNYIRTGEKAVLSKSGRQFTFLNNHWDSQDHNTHSRAADAVIAAVGNSSPAVIVGDFNTGQNYATNKIIARGFQCAYCSGIDYIMSKGLRKTGQKKISHGYPAAISDHPVLVADFQW